MQEVFEKIKERLEEVQEIDIYLDGRPSKQIISYVDAIEIVNQVAEEYGNDVNVGNSWEIVYDKVLKLEKEYAMSGDIENVNDCIRLENLLQYFKEELRDENNQSLTNDGWIPCSERLPEPNMLVLVSTDAGKIDVDYYGAYIKGFIGLKGTGQKAIAWRPLPEPYRGE